MHKHQFMVIIEPELPGILADRLSKDLFILSRVHQGCPHVQ